MAKVSIVKWSQKWNFVYHHGKEKSYRGPMEVFGNGMTRGTTWEDVEVTKMKSAA